MQIIVGNVGKDGLKQDEKGSQCQVVNEKYGKPTFLDITYLFRLGGRAGRIAVLQRIKDVGFGLGFNGHSCRNVFLRQVGARVPRDFAPVLSLRLTFSTERRH